MTRDADVCLIVEGTYPYVRGGVSTWIHDLISGMPDRSFHLLHVGAKREDVRTRRYEFAKNVVGFTEVFVHETVTDRGRRCGAREKRDAFARVRAYQQAGPEQRRTMLAEVIKLFADPRQRALSVDDALSSHEAWEFVVEQYQEQAPGTSFIDYFWTWRSVYAPLLQTLIADIPRAGLYHAVSTGYAGLLGAVAKLRHQAPFVLTEHGIYVRERLLDIGRADWIWEEPVRVRLASATTNPLKRLWLDFFSGLGQVAYEAADDVITLFGANMDIQRQFGADPRRTRIIPNGVRTEAFTPLAAARPPRGTRPLRVGFVGRIVPIKDVKTLLRAFSEVEKRIPDVELWLVGPTDEDPEYFEACKAIVEGLGLKRVTFTGHRDVKEIYPEIDVLVLTSISEGQPLSILEAACAGVPCVATDVGACRELLEGGAPNDRALGKTGLVTSIGAPEETARALITLLNDEEMRNQFALAGQERVKRFYRQDQVIESYRALYGSRLGKEASWRASASR